jgi:hypothetical protein
MATCQSCGLEIGRDCFNQQECAEITRAMCNDFVHLQDTVQHLRELCSRRYAAIEAILEALQDRYDGAPDSTTLWMGQHIDDLKAAIGEA